MNPSSLSCWRKRLGESDVESLLSATIEAALASKEVKPRELRRVTVDTTVQEKAIAFLTDSKLYNRARERLLAQQRQDKHKLYALHAPEVECIAKGKVPKRYEFGVKVSIAATNRSNLVVGAQSLPGNPHDSHTLKDALRQVQRLTGHQPERCYVDLGYRGHDVDDIQVFKARRDPQHPTGVKTPQCHRTDHRTHETRWTVGAQLSQGR